MKNITYEDKREPIAYFIDSCLTPQIHFHNHIEVVFVISGEAIAHADKKNFLIKPNDCFFTFPNQIHYYETIKLGKFLVLIFSPDILFGANSLLFDSIPKTNILSLQKNNMGKDLLMNILNNSESFDQMRIAGLINQFFSVILPKTVLIPRIKTNNSTLSEVLNYCSANFSEEIDLDNVAEQLHISKFHISHLINNKLGINFNTYINSLRIDCACELLENTEKNVTEISSEVGFGSIRSFNRAFKSIINLTPNEYRNRLWQQKFK